MRTWFTVIAIAASTAVFAAAVVVVIGLLSSDGCSMPADPSGLVCLGSDTDRPASLLAVTIAVGSVALVLAAVLTQRLRRRRTLAPSS